MKSNTIKFIIFGLIITICLCILFSCNFTIVEGLNNIDCSKCEVKPTSGKCTQIKDISYDRNFNFTNNNMRDFVFDIIDTSYVFCPWEPNCNNYTDNLESTENRIGNDPINIGNSIKNNIQCCPYDNFYSENTKNINMLPQFKHIKTICDRIYADRTEMNLLLHGSSNKYFNLRSLCNQPDLSGLYFNEEIASEGNILLDETLTPQELIDYQNILELKLTTTGGQTTLQRSIDLSNLNTQLLNLDSNSATYGDEKMAIQRDLVHYFVSTISFENYNYFLLDSNALRISERANLRTLGSLEYKNYELSNNQFYNCQGELKTIEERSFTQTDLQNLENNNYFDVDSNAPYTTMQDNIQRPYPSREDLEMEIRNLPQVSSTDNVPASVINTYLNSINNFYEKQLANMVGPRTHAVPQTIEFDNHSSLTTPSTFFTYDGPNNDNFDCEPSVTGDDKFKYCGPTSYYTEFKF